MLYLGLRLLHIASMALWFAPMVLFVGDIRRSLVDGGDVRALAARVTRANRIAAVAGTLTVLSGVALLVTVGGFRATSPAIHTGLLLGIVMWVLGGAGIGRISARLVAAIARGAPVAELQAIARPLAPLTGVFHLLWALTLTLMVLRTLWP